MEANSWDLDLSCWVDDGSGRWNRGRQMRRKFQELELQESVGLLWKWVASASWVSKRRGQIGTEWLRTQRRGQDWSFSILKSIPLSGKRRLGQRGRVWLRSYSSWTSPPRPPWGPPSTLSSIHGPLACWISSHTAFHSAPQRSRAPSYSFSPDILLLFYPAQSHFSEKLFWPPEVHRVYLCNPYSQFLLRVTVCRNQT